MFQRGTSGTILPCLLLLPFLLASCATSSSRKQEASSVRLDLSNDPSFARGSGTFREEENSSPKVELKLTGGLLHAAEFIAQVELGGQKFNLQVDTSSGSLIVPQAGCSTCRMGDRRYNVSLSDTGSELSCEDNRCQAEECSPRKCGKCSSRGACCYDERGKCGFYIRYADHSAGKGTLLVDKLKIGTVEAEVMFSGVLKETRGFELPYADGILGMSWRESTCHPTCMPTVMDTLVSSVGMKDVFTMCVNSFGGTLVLGEAESRFAVEKYRYVRMLHQHEQKHYLVSAQRRIRIGEQEIHMPGLTKALWSSTTSFIGVGKDVFEAILEYFLGNLCEIPDLCSLHTWFRPSSCLALEEKWFALLPDITFTLSDDVDITLTPDDYLIRYKKNGGKQHRCVGFIILSRLEAKGIGLVLGNAVLRRYSVVFDRENRQIGVARCDPSLCGPSTGSSRGFLASSGSSAYNKTAALSATDPGIASLSVLPRSNAAAAALLLAETCRALTNCRACARNRQCAYNYQQERCAPKREFLATAGFIPYPNCHGATCMCFAVGGSGWILGIVLGALAGLLVVLGLARLLFRKRSANVYHEVQTFENDGIETF